MSTDNNNVNGPAQEPGDELPATPDNGDSPEEGTGDVPRMMQVPAEFVERLPPHVLETLPQEIQANLRRGGGDLVTHTSVTSMSMMLGSMVNPIAARVTEQHITDIIGIRGREIDHDYGDRKIGRFVWAGLVAFAVLALISIIVILAVLEMADLLREIMFALAGLVGGFGAGYGYSSSRRR